MFVQLRRPSDNEASDPRPFQYLPMESGSFDGVDGSLDIAGGAFLARKRIKPDFQLYSHILAVDAAVLARRMFHAAEEGGGRQADQGKRVNHASVQCDRGSVAQSDSAAPVLPAKGRVDPPSRSGSASEPPPLPEKGAGFAKLKGNLIKPGEGVAGRSAGKTVNFDQRSSVATIISESESEARFSLASSEDLNSRLSAAFSDYSDLTDAPSIADSEADVNDALSLVSSTHTLNDRLSMLSDASDMSDSGQTVIETDGAKSETDSIDTIERQLEMLELMSVEPDGQTYSSFQMAMRQPIYGPSSWPARPRATDKAPVKEVEKDDEEQVYDDPDPDPVVEAPPVVGHAEHAKVEVVLPTVPPRVESMGVSTPPLPPRRFKKMNQPLPEPPSKDLGLKIALQAIKQTFMKAKPAAHPTGSKATAALRASQENVKEASSKTAVVGEEDARGIVTQSNDQSNSVLPSQSGDPLDTLTEAENFALYMSLAPLATASEFDENETVSMLYGELGHAGRDAAAESTVNTK